MKPIVVLFLIFLILPIISAIEFDVKEEFSQGETLMAKVSGNFLQPLQKENVFFYRAHVKIPLEYDIKKLDNEYYIYALLSGKQKNNYSISLEGIKYMKGSEIIEEDIKRNFTINNQTADFSIKPGFANTNIFSIEVWNLQDKEITIEIKTKEDTNSSGEEYQSPINLKSGQKQEIDFFFEEPMFQIIELSTEDLIYNIPADIPTLEIPEQEIFMFEPKEFPVSSNTSTETKRTIYIHNTGDEPLTDITISLSNLLENYVTLSKEAINKIAPGSNVPIELIFFSEEEFEIQGHIKARQGDKIIYSEISVIFLDNYVPPEEPQQESTIQTCAEKGYPICSNNEVCNSEEIIRAKDGICCVGTCQEKETSSAGVIIGVLILIVITGFLIWFFKTKYKGAKNPINLLKIAKGKKEE